jgi:glycosyltransferase involved in cell wall biosynthesis
MVIPMTSIVMTVFDRPVEVILRTLRCLRECDLSDTQVVVVNDGSKQPYKSVRTYLEEGFESGVWFDMPEYEAFRLSDGSNNPARAFNQAVSLATGENLIVMSSDVMVPPKTMAKAKKADFSQGVWTPSVEDTWGNLAIGREYCGPNRLFPMPWFLGVSKTHLLEVGGWDEGYLGGLCYEDNDVVGRVALKTGRFVGDWSVKVYHQGHEQGAYDFEQKDVLDANMRNREYTQAKWGGIPFDREYTPFDVVRKMQKSGNAAHECIDKAGKLEAAVAKTTGLLQVKDAVSQ